MNFVEQIKKSLFEPNKHRGYNHDDVLVSEKALRELLRHFERLDANARVEDRKGTSEHRLLHDLICQMWHNNGQQADRIMVIFSETIATLLNEKKRLNNVRFKG